MELSYTDSLNRSTRPSEHVTVQISYACKTTAGFINCFPRINFVFDVYLTKYVTVQISLPIRLPGWQVFIIV